MLNYGLNSFLDEDEYEFFNRNSYDCEDFLTEEDYFDEDYERDEYYINSREYEV